MKRTLVINDENKQKQLDKEQNDGWFDLIGEYAEKNRRLFK